MWQEKIGKSKPIKVINVSSETFKTFRSFKRTNEDLKKKSVNFFSWLKLSTCHHTNLPSGTRRAVRSLSPVKNSSAKTTAKSTSLRSAASATVRSTGARNAKSVGSLTTLSAAKRSATRRSASPRRKSARRRRSARRKRRSSLNAPLLRPHPRLPPALALFSSLPRLPHATIPASMASTVVKLY